MASCGSITVVSDFATSAVVANCPTFASETMTEGSAQSASANVENRNDQRAQCDVVLEFDGQEMARATVEVPANGSSAAGFNFTAPGPGDYSVSVFTQNVTQL